MSGLQESSLVETIPRRRGTSTTRGSSQSSSGSSSRGSTRRSQTRRRAHASTGLSSSTATCAPHAPLLPCSWRASPLVLEPPPNMRTQCTCLVDDTLVTTHRNGIRLYRPGAPDTNTGDSQGVWHLVEARSTFDLRDAYLCTAAQPLLTKRRGLYRSKYARYFCVAAGSDRSVHSLSVLSTRAHFSVQHTEHQGNRICAVHLSQVAVQPFREDNPIAIAVSADELGGICILDVEGEKPFTLLQSDSPAPRDLRLTTLQRWVASASRQQRERVPYRYADGVITHVALAGPCLELCTGCRNACSPDGVSTAATLRRPSWLLMSVIVTARGRDVPADEPTRASLHASLVRFVLSDDGAFVLWETTLTDVVAPVRVCESGPALSVPPYEVGEPVCVLLASPRLTLEALQGCSGTVLRTYTNPSPVARGEDEYLLQWVPLGHRRLLQRSDAAAEDSAEKVWRCAVALTSECAVLLVGLPDTEPAKQPATGEPAVSAAVETGPLLDGGEKLDGWLDEIELTGADSPAVVGGGRSPSVRSPPPASADAHVMPYTVLAELFNPLQGPWGHGVISFLVDWRQNALLLVLADRETILRVPLPLGPALALEDDDTKAGETATAVEGGKSSVREGSTGAFGLASSVWESTTKGVTAVANATVSTHWVAPTRWTTSVFSRWRGGGPDESHSREPSAPSPPPTVVDTAPPVTAHTYSLVRPLAVALATLTGGIADETPPPSSQHADTPATKDACDGLASTIRSVSTTSAEGDGTTSARRETQSPSVSRPALSSSRSSTHAAGEGKTHRSLNSTHRRRAQRSRSRGTDTSVRSSQATNVSHDDMDTYMSAQLHRAQDAVVRLASSTSEPDTAHATGSHVCEELEKLVAVDEPHERAQLFYEWRDAHDSLFIQATSARERLETAAKGDSDVARARDEAIAELYGRYARVDVAQGKHSLHFLTVVDALAARRQRTRDHRGRFAFEAYFGTTKVPQHLLDLQEQEKCRFELRDLQRRQEAELLKLRAQSVVEILQNEEKRALPGAPGRYRWESHATFPFDDKDGHTIDLLALNQWADTTGSREWRWKTEEDDDATAMLPLANAGRQQIVPPRRTPQAVAKHLKGWSVGPWQYAAHWPTTAQEREDPRFWASTDDAACKVRCRVLRRTRVHEPTNAQRQQLIKAHSAQLEQLRIDLGL